MNDRFSKDFAFLLNLYYIFYIKIDYHFSSCCHFIMPSRSTHRSHNRNHSKRHKKSHKRSRKLSDERSPSSSNNSTKKEKISNDNDKLTIKEEETVKTSTEDQLTSKILRIFFFP